MAGCTYPGSDQALQAMAEFMLARPRDETGLVFPRQGFGPGSQRDFHVCSCLISVLVGLGLGLGAAQLCRMRGLYPSPRRAVTPAAPVGLLMWIFLAQFPFAFPADPVPWDYWVQAGQEQVALPRRL